MFDDALLDDPVTFRAGGESLIWLATAGARLRSENPEDGAAVTAVLAKMGAGRPRSVLVVGAESRLVRDLVQPSCHVPVISWPTTEIPAWAGPLDLVVILAGDDERWLGFRRSALRRGAMVMVVAPLDSPLMDEPGSAVLLPTRDGDPWVAAVLSARVLSGLGLGGTVDLVAVADRLDQVAEACGPRHALGSNPAKDLACALAEAVPLIHGRSALAAQAARQMAEGLRQVTGLPALAGGEETLGPLLQQARPRDMFADPFETQTGVPTYVVVILDDGEPDQARVDLAGLAANRFLRVEHICQSEGSPVERYAGLWQHGLLATAYLRLATTEGGHE